MSRIIIGRRQVQQLYKNEIVIRVSLCSYLSNKYRNYSCTNILGFCENYRNHVNEEESIWDTINELTGSLVKLVNQTKNHLVEDVEKSAAREMV